MSFEIERKWLLDKLPEMCKFKEPCEIEQCYFAQSPTVRIRKSLQHDSPYRMAIKGPGSIKRVELEEDISEEFYEKIKKFMVNPIGIVNKKFWKFPIEGTNLSYEMSIVDDIWCYVEVEFETEKEANSFEAPDWFGKDVTDFVSIKGYSDMKIKLGKAFDLPKLVDDK